MTSSDRQRFKRLVVPVSKKSRNTWKPWERSKPKWKSFRVELPQKREIKSVKVSPLSMRRSSRGETDMTTSWTAASLQWRWETIEGVTDCPVIGFQSKSIVNEPTQMIKSDRKSKLLSSGNYTRTAIRHGKSSRRISNKLTNTIYRDREITVRRSGRGTSRFCRSSKGRRSK